MAITETTNIYFTSVIGDFVEARRRELGLSKSDLVHGLGYVNHGKGHRKYQAFLAGRIEQGFILDNLAQILSLKSDEISSALERTRQNIQEAEHLERERKEAEWRKSFQVHGIIETERNFPQPIFIAALVGVENLKLVKLDATSGAESYPQQMMKEISNRVSKNGAIISFGVPTGFVINYSPGYALRYDLEGRQLEEMEEALRLGVAYLRF